MKSALWVSASPFPDNPRLSDTVGTSKVYFTAFLPVPEVFFPVFQPVRLWHRVGDMVVYGVAADRGVTAWNQQVISQPTGSARFSDTRDAVWKKARLPHLSSSVLLLSSSSSSSSSLDLLHHGGEVKTNTGRFVLQENPAALNSGGSSRARLRVPVENKQGS